MAQKQLNEELYANVANWEEYPEFSDAERVALEFTEKFALDHLALDAGFFEQIELARRAVEVAGQVLRPGGHLVIKVFDGEDAHAFVQSVRPGYRKVKRVRPEAVRKESREFFLVCLERISPSSDSRS